MDVTILEHLTITAAGARTRGGTETNFTYSCNQDVVLTSLTIDFPGYGPFADPDAPGHKTAGTTYHSAGWNCGGGQMPTGDHEMEFLGSWILGTFDITVTVHIN